MKGRQHEGQFAQQQYPGEHPDAILPDLSKPDPLVVFTRAKSHWPTAASGSTRYFTKVGDDYYVFRHSGM